MTTVLGSTGRIPADRMAGAISPRPPSSGTRGAAAVLGAGVTPWRANVNPRAAGGGLIAGMPIRSDGPPPKPPKLPPGPRPCMAPPARAGMPLMTAKPRLIRTTSQRFIGISQCTLAASRLALANHSCNPPTSRGGDCWLTFGIRMNRIEGHPLVTDSFPEFHELRAAPAAVHASRCLGPIREDVVGAG